MKTYAVFPGLEALFQASRNRRWLEYPQVRQTFDEVSVYLSELTGNSEDLAAFLATSARPHISDLDRTFIAHTAIQVGIWRMVSQQIKVDGLAGCSVGDLARLHISESLPLAETIDLVWYCTVHRKECPSGRMANVRPFEGQFNESQLTFLKNCGVSASIWSNRHAALAGTQQEMDAIAAPAKQHRLKVRQIYDYPFHSEVMRPLADSIAAQGARWEVKPVSIPVFSSIWLRHINQPDEIRLEALANACEPVNWKEAVDIMHREYGVERFLNIGPSDTLTGWIENSNTDEKPSIIDAWDLMQKNSKAA